jgi:hypothetical protein
VATNVLAALPNFGFPAAETSQMFAGIPTTKNMGVGDVRRRIFSRLR